MLRIAVGKNGYLSNASRDGSMLPVKEINIKMTMEETIVHLVLVEYDGELVRERDEVIRYGTEPMQFIFLEEK